MDLARGLFTALSLHFYGLSVATRDYSEPVKRMGEYLLITLHNFDHRQL